MNPDWNVDDSSERDATEALGPALPEQVNTDMGEMESDGEKLAGIQDEVSPVDIEPENKPAVQSSIAEQVPEPDTDNQEVPNAAARWSNYESLTERPSQDLARTLHAILEPTLANNYSGHHTTGPRIDKRRMVPYAAGKCWDGKNFQKRTVPIKREYRILIAVDDSLFMSDSGCRGSVITALVTVCRAIPQLMSKFERILLLDTKFGKKDSIMVSLAVASFGKQGSEKILHEFGQPFTTESGIEMISSVESGQENLIEDQPVVEPVVEPVFNLLGFMNEMLATFAEKRRRPGQLNPFDEYAIIIGNGKLQEREKLERSVKIFTHDRDRINRGVTYLILDHDPNNSILEAEEYLDADGNVRRANFRPVKREYRDPFPFESYVIEKNKENVAKTLSGLLTQWFELAINSHYMGTY